MNRSRPLQVECLEDRCTPATFGNPWADAHHLTLSFAPDGTQVGPYANQAPQLLDSAFAGNRAAWQREILRAFQTWVVHGNVNLSVVGDGGLPFGSAGPIQGDDRFGDIRVGAAQLSSLVLALEQPFDVNAGTWAGDLVLNAKHRFGKQPATGFDLYSVALHEAGHVFGLDHCNNPASSLYETYGGVRTGLIAEDIARLQALYGVRTPDRYEGNGGNATFATATDLPLFGGLMSLPAPADITTLADKDVYRVTVAPLLGTTIELRTSGFSLLTAKLTVFDNNGKVVDVETATNPAAGDLAIRLPTSLLPKTYYVRVESGSSDVFGIGSYDLDARPDLVSFSVDTLRHALAIAQDLLHDVTNNTLDGALGLGQLIVQTDKRFDYVYEASISYTGDVDYFAFKSPTALNGAANVMTVMVWGDKPNQLEPRASVVDAFGNPVAARVLLNEGGNWALQVDNAAPNAVYYVSVRADDPAGPRNKGDYFLGIDFATAAFKAKTMLTNDAAVTGPSSQSAAPGLGLWSKQDNLFHFVLSTKSTGVPAGTSLRMTVTNAAGQTVATLLVKAGETRSLTLFLGRGNYTVRLAGVGKNGETVAPPLFTLVGNDLSDPVKPYEYDPTYEQANSSSPPPSSGDSGSTQTASSSDTWYEGSYSYATW